MTKFAPIRAALGFLAPGKTVYVPGTSGESSALIEALKEQPQASRGVRFVSMWIPGINAFDYTSLHPEARSTSFFPLPQLKNAILSGRTELMPHSYYRAYEHIERHIDFDVTFVHVSPPDENGDCSLGIAADFAAVALARATKKVALVNPAMPATFGDTKLPAAGFDALIMANGPLVTMDTTPPSPSHMRVGANIAPLVEDGDCLQLGLGTMQHAVAHALKDKRNLRIFAGMISDPVILLDRGGALAPDDGAITTGIAAGGQALIDWVRDNPRVHFKSVETTHGPRVGLEHHRFVAINSAIEIDLLGQVNGEAADGRLISSSGGLTDFMRAAARHPNGLPIIALPSSSRKGRVSRIVPTLAPGTPINLLKSDPLIVVTEHGVADLRHLGLDQRAAALIAIAAPQHREPLAHDWHTLRLQLFG